MNGSGVQQAHSRLYNTSDSSTLGMGSYVRLASDETAPSVGVARFTLGSTKNIELQIYTQNQTGSIPAESSVTGEVDLGGFVYLEKE
jgi:two-component sensor histidine kinase